MSALRISEETNNLAGVAAACNFLRVHTPFVRETDTTAVWEHLETGGREVLVPRSLRWGSVFSL